MQCGETEAIGTQHHHHACARNINAHLNHRCPNQHIKLSRSEGGHVLSAKLCALPPVHHTNAQLRECDGK